MRDGDLNRVLVAVFGVLWALPLDARDCEHHLTFLAEGRFKKVFSSLEAPDRVFLLLIDHLSDKPDAFIQNEQDLHDSILDHFIPLDALGIPRPKTYGLVNVPGKGPAVEMERIHATLADLRDSRHQVNGRSADLFRELKTHGPQFYKEWKAIVAKLEAAQKFPDDLAPSQIGIRKISAGQYELVLLDPIIGRYRTSLEDYLGRPPSEEERQSLWSLDFFESDQIGMKDWAQGLAP